MKKILMIALITSGTCNIYTQHKRMEKQDYLQNLIDKYSNYLEKFAVYATELETRNWWFQMEAQYNDGTLEYLSKVEYPQSFIQAMIKQQFDNPDASNRNSPLFINRMNNEFIKTEFLKTKISPYKNPKQIT